MSAHSTIITLSSSQSQDPDMMLGDFNVTEELIDRALAHLDDTNAIIALQNLCQCLGLEDSWHHAFPHERPFTCPLVDDTVHPPCTTGRAGR